MDAKKTLIVTDKNDVGKSIRSRQDVKGFKIFEAENSHDAIDVFIKEKPDLVVLDMTLPNRDGWAVCNFIKRQSDSKNTRIVMFNGQNFADI